MKKSFQLAVLFLLLVLMFSASGRRGNYSCVSPWTGETPQDHAPANAHP